MYSFISMTIKYICKNMYLTRGSINIMINISLKFVYKVIKIYF